MGAIQRGQRVPACGRQDGRRHLPHWWDAPSNTPAAKHTHMSNCSLSTHAPYQCNPSCRASQSMPKYAQVTAMLKPDIKGACGIAPARASPICELGRCPRSLSVSGSWARWVGVGIRG